MFAESDPLSRTADAQIRLIEPHGSHSPYAEATPAASADGNYNRRPDGA
jgi:hypothetical protein